jgi:hypothetical protein
MVAAGPLSRELEESLFPRSAAHAEEVRAEARALARVRPAMDPGAIHWAQRQPESIAVCSKINSLARRVEYIRWKTH